MSRFIPLFTCIALSTGCASRTVITSSPSGAMVKTVNGVELGQTPYQHSNQGLTFTEETLIVSKPGFKDVPVQLKKDQLNGVNLAVGGLVVISSIATGAIPLLVLGVPPLLWSADFKPTYNARLARDASPTRKGGRYQEEEESEDEEFEEDREESQGRRGRADTDREDRKRRPAGHARRR